MRFPLIVSIIFCIAACGGGGAVTNTTGTTSTTSTTGSDINGDLQSRRIFPADDPWNTRIDTAPTDTNSDNLIASIGLTAGLHPDFGADFGGTTFGIPYVLVRGTQNRVKVTFGYSDQSDPGPYPVPTDAPIEGGAGSTGDRHVLVIDRDNWILYELFDAHPQSDGS